MIWIFLPRLLVVDLLLLLGRIVVESITGRVDELDGVLELCGSMLANDFIRGIGMSSVVPTPASESSVHFGERFTA
jgi:hypothetical protein